MCLQIMLAFFSNTFQAARKAKSRISSALLVAGDNTEEVPRSHKRRPTVSRHKPKNSISEENLDEKVEARVDTDVKKNEEVTVVITKEEKRSPMVTKKAKAPTAPKSSVDFGKSKTYYLKILVKRIFINSVNYYCVL